MLGSHKIKSGLVRLLSFLFFKFFYAQNVVGINWLHDPYGIFFLFCWKSSFEQISKCFFGFFSSVKIFRDWRCQLDPGALNEFWIMTEMQLSAKMRVHFFHQANPHIHQQLFDWATTFRSGLPQPLIKAGGNPDQNAVAQSICCWWMCGFAWWLWFPSKNHHWNRCFFFCSCKDNGVFSFV